MCRPSGEPGVRVGCADRRDDLAQPLPRRRPGRRDHAVRVLVPEVPHPNSVVAGQRSSRLARQQGLRPGDTRVRVPVPQPASVDPAVAHHTKAIVAVGPAERPCRNPVHAAHVTGEEGGNERDARAGGQIRHGDQTIQHPPIHLVRGRLEVRPGKEDPDRVETARGDPREICGDLRAIEVRPPPHRRSSRPVVDAEPKTISRRERVRQRCLRVVRDRAPRRGDRARDSRRPCGWSRSVARPRRARASCPSRRPRARRRPLP